MLSFESKLKRARQHLEELRAEIDAWVKSRPYRLSDKIDPHSGDNIIYGQLLRPLPDRVLQLTGDCLQNLRSALDHIAFALALFNKPHLPDAEARRVAFPIFKLPKLFSDLGAKK